MPYVEKRVNALLDEISDLGWERQSIEFDLDMCPDHEPWEEMAKQEEAEIKLAYAIPEYKWNKDIKRVKHEWWELWSESDY